MLLTQQEPTNILAVSLLSMKKYENGKSETKYDIWEIVRKLFMQYSITDYSDSIFGLEAHKKS